jgi:hypothetical protein
VKLIRLLVVVVVLTVLTTASRDCASTPVPLSSEADLIGLVTGIHASGEGESIGELAVESHADKIVSKYLITIRDEALILQQHGDDLRQVGFDAFESRQWVRVWFDGPVSESFPVQGTAGQIVILHGS